MLNLLFDKDDGTFQNCFKYAHLENTSGDMVPKNSMPIAKY